MLLVCRVCSTSTEATTTSWCRQLFGNMGIKVQLPGRLSVALEQQLLGQCKTGNTSQKTLVWQRQQDLCRSLYCYWGWQQKHLYCSDSWPGQSRHIQGERQLEQHFLAERWSYQACSPLKRVATDNRALPYPVGNQINMTLPSKRSWRAWDFSAMRVMLSCFKQENAYVSAS